MKWTFPNLRLFLALAVITGGIYPAAVTLVSLAVFPHQAHGSLIRNEQGEVIASELIAQPFTSAKYFWPRPSAGDYATMPSGASNLSWTSAELVKTVAERKACRRGRPFRRTCFLRPAAVWSPSSHRRRRNSR